MIQHHNFLKWLLSISILISILGLKIEDRTLTKPALSNAPISLRLSLDTKFKNTASTTYTLSGQIIFSTPIDNGILKIKVGNEELTFTAPFTNSIQFSFENLPKDGAKHQVLAWLENAPEIMVLSYFKAPVLSTENKSIACTVFVTVAAGACDPITNTYDVTGNLLFFEPPTTGTLTVRVGSVQQVFNAPFNGTLPYSLLRMVADGSDHKLTAEFSDVPTCRIEEIYRAPAACAVDKCSISIVVSASACNNTNNQYSLSGNIFLNNSPTTGNLIIRVSGTSIEQTFTTPFTSSVPFVLPGLPADGLEHEVVAWFEEDGFCSATALFNAPAPCNPACDIDIVYWVGKCNGAIDNYTLHGTVVLSNPPVTGTITITVNGADLVFNAPFNPVIGYTFTTLPADGLNHDIQVNFSDELTCIGLKNYQAPDICPACAIEMEVVVGPCDPVSNTYSVSGRLALTNPPTPGFLTVDIEGNTHTFYAPFDNKIQLYQIGGLPADGAIHSANAIFTLENSCVANENYLAPLCPVSCDFYAKIIENNCCKSCNSGNLNVLTAHWKESNKELVSENVGYYKPSMFLGTPSHQHSNAFLSNDGAFQNNTTSTLDYASSKAVDNPWWHLDLVGNYDVETITIYGRTDCCFTQNHSFIVFTSLTPFPALPYQELIDDPNILNFSQNVVGGTPFTIVVNAPTRFVRIQEIGYGSLELVEVEVIGSGNSSSSPYAYHWSDPNIGN